jgi:hypothetical protein
VNESTQRRKGRKGDFLQSQYKASRTLRRQNPLMNGNTLKVDAREGVDEQGRYTFTRDYQRGN